MFINDQLVRDVLRAWIDDQNHPGRGRAQKPIPTEADLAALLDTTLRASFLKEEGKPVLTSITWVSPSDFDAHEIGRARESRLTLDFDTPIAFEAHNIAKLSGIVNGKSGALLACRAESGAHIWGICYFTRGTDPIGQIPAGTLEVHHSSPDYPTVTITGVASVQITRSGSVVGRIETGSFQKAQATVLTSYMLGQYLYRLIGIEVDFRTRTFKNEEETAIAFSFRDCVEFIIDVLSQRRTGATIIFVPPKLQGRALSESFTAWGIHGSLEIDRLQRARIRYGKQAQENASRSQILFRLVTDQALRDRLRNLVDLACVDGALLLTPSFEVIGFGVKLKSQKWDRELKHGPVVPEGELLELDFSRLGTRHNSARDFVGSINGAIAFVASSDGPIRALVKSTEEKIWYWPDCRVSMFSR